MPANLVRRNGAGAEASPAGMAPAGSSARSVADSLTSREWDQLTDIVVRRLERRLADELARRGRRFTPRVF